MGICHYEETVCNYLFYWKLRLLKKKKKRENLWTKKCRFGGGWKMVEMIIYILHFSSSRNNRSLQEFQSTCSQGITWTVASSGATIINMRVLFFDN